MYFFLDEQGHLALLFFVQYENGGNGIFYPAKMLNYSEEGMYFETIQ
jgi:hypothetical protein